MMSPYSFESKRTREREREKERERLQLQFRTKIIHNEGGKKITDPNSIAEVWRKYCAKLYSECGSTISLKFRSLFVNNFTSSNYI